MWPWLRPLATLNLELKSEAIRDLPPLLKAVIFTLDCGVLKLLSLINMSSKYTATTSNSSPSGCLPIQRFRILLIQPSLLIARPPTLI